MTDTTDPLGEFEAAHARLEAIMAEAQSNTARASRLADDARTAEATVRSARGEVTVTARAGGVITSVTFSEAARELAAQALGQLTVNTIAQAQHEAAMRFAERAADELGAGSPLADGLRADAEQAFPSPNGGLQR